MERTCSSCGKKFTYEIPAGLHHPRECLEGLDLECPSCDPNVYTTECKGCREKQDGMRA